jgi:hypothetical protein
MKSCRVELSVHTDVDKLTGMDKTKAKGLNGAPINVQSCANSSPVPSTSAIPRAGPSGLAGADDLTIEGVASPWGGTIE